MNRPSGLLMLGGILVSVFTVLMMASGLAEQLPAAPLAVGSKAPDFDLQATGNRRVKRSDFRGHNLIIVFYPKDQTHGCTIQLCALRDDLKRFRTLNTDIVASNPGSLESHEAFVAKQHYPFPILVDTNRNMAKAYGVKSILPGINQRTVFIVDTRGIIRYAIEGLPSTDELAGAIQKFPMPNKAP